MQRPFGVYEVRVPERVEITSGRSHNALETQSRASFAMSHKPYSCLGTHFSSRQVISGRSQNNRSNMGMWHRSRGWMRRRSAGRSAHPEGPSALEVDPTPRARLRFPLQASHGNHPRLSQIIPAMLHQRSVRDRVCEPHCQRPGETALRRSARVCREHRRRGVGGEPGSASCSQSAEFQRQIPMSLPQEPSHRLSAMFATCYLFIHQAPSAR